MTGQQHIIKRLTLQLNMPVGHREGFVMQQELKRQCVEKINEELDSTLSALTSPQQILRIDKLEIDLGSLTEKQFIPAFVRLVKERIQETSLRENSKGETTEGSVHGIAPHRTSRTQRWEDLFLYFLIHGSFPWWAHRVKWSDLEDELMPRAPFQGTGPFTSRMKQALKSRPACLDRLVWQCSSEFLTGITASLQNASKKKNSRFDPATFSELSKKAQRHLIEDLIDGGKFASETPLPFNEASKPIYSDIQTNIEADRNRFPTGLSANTAGNDDARGNKNDLDFFSSTMNGATGIRGDEAPLRSSTFSPQEAGEHENEGYFIEIAGLAIALPFLTHFFKDLDLLTPERQFKGIEAQQRAIHLTQFLATGETQSTEPALVLNKVLCNWEVEKPIPKDISLSDEEKEKADALLRHIIENWGVLKNTSPDGLRYNFLMRSGKLSLVNSHWQLQVEPQAYDSYLLDKLPWTISIVAFKWMSRRVHVEWI